MIDVFIVLDIGRVESVHGQLRSRSDGSEGRPGMRHSAVRWWSGEDSDQDRVHQCADMRQQADFWNVQQATTEIRGSEQNSGVIVWKVCDSVAERRKCIVDHHQTFMAGGRTKVGGKLDKQRVTDRTTFQRHARTYSCIRITSVVVLKKVHMHLLDELNSLKKRNKQLRELNLWFFTCVSCSQLLTVLSCATWSWSSRAGQQYDCDLFMVKSCTRTLLSCMTQLWSSTVILHNLCICIYSYYYAVTTEIVNTDYTSF